MQSSNYTPRYLPKLFWNCVHKNLYVNINRGFIHNLQKWGSTKMQFKRGKNELNYGLSVMEWGSSTIKKQVFTAMQEHEWITNVKGNIKNVVWKSQT
jgi:hypothetical protein